MKRRNLNKSYLLAFLSIFACRSDVENTGRFTYNDIVIKINSPTECQYVIWFNKDSINVKSMNFSYNSKTKEMDSIFLAQSFQLAKQDKEYLDNFLEWESINENKIDDQITQDLYKYELLIQNNVVKKAICCDSAILKLLQQVVLPNVSGSRIDCNSFFQIIEEIE